MSSEDFQSIDVQFSWEICPPEILWEVFRYLCNKSLFYCLFVSRRWKNVANDFIEVRYTKIVLWTAFILKYLFL